MKGAKDKSKKSFWRKVSQARVDVERIFGIFFINKYKRLDHWDRRSDKRYARFTLHVLAALCLYKDEKWKKAEFPYLTFDK